MGQTIAEKIFNKHLVEQLDTNEYVLKLDLVLCHEITTPTAITDLMERDIDAVFDSQKVKAVIDHVTPSKDTKSAAQAKILRDWALRNGLTDFLISAVMGYVMPFFLRKGL